jgi:hypothetical protein
MRLLRLLSLTLPLAAVLGSIPASTARAQATNTAPAQAPATTPAANPADVASPDAIIAALYDVISGPAGQARNWNRMRSLFIPGARLIPTGLRPDSSVSHSVLTVEDYITRAGPGLERNGFFEREIGRTTETFGNVTHVFSAYDSKRTAQDEKPFSRGINSIQLLNDGKRWWVVTIFWDSERPNNPIPEKYLSK